jgi:hypothetical protein
MPGFLPHEIADCVQSCLALVSAMRILQRIQHPALAGLLLTLPWVILEAVNRRNLPGDFPWFLFAVLWLMPTVIVSLTLPLFRDINHGKPVLYRALAAPVVILAAILWIAILQDQMPCFFGVENCD